MRLAAVVVQVQVSSYRHVDDMEEGIGLGWLQVCGLMVGKL